jgi:putative pyruvate formate lyase activating enzyme
MPSALQSAETASFTPAYLRLWESGELERRAERALAKLADCALCPRDCHANRVLGKPCACRTGRYAVVSSYFPHFGEEDCLRGLFGSGTIFFGFCNLRCVFCQNYEISQLVAGREVTPGELATMMLELQDAGCHNVNLVTPEHVVPQILEALPIAVEEGLELPLVYNTSSYGSAECLELMDGVVDVYMPDFKFWSSERAKRYCRRGDYPDVARRAILEMHRQVGDLVLDEHGLARRGVLLRHLVMPGMLEETEAILRWVADELGPDTYVNLMEQYRPDDMVGRGRYAEIDRSPSRAEFATALDMADRFGLRRIDRRGAMEGLLHTAG